MEEVIASKFQCWRAGTVTSYIYTVEARNAREAAIKAAPMITRDTGEHDEDFVLVRVKGNGDKAENWRVSIQRKFTLDEE